MAAATKSTKPENGTLASSMTAEQAAQIMAEQEALAKQEFIDAYNDMVKRTGYQIVGFPTFRTDGTTAVRFEVQKTVKT